MSAPDRHDGELIARLEALHAPYRAQLPEEVEAKYRKMAGDPYGYFRGTATLFHDAVQRERSAFVGPPADWLLLNGDVHLQNYGARRDATGLAVFDLADFDEAEYGPVVHDVWRLATSLILAARPRGLSEDAIGDSLQAFAEHYGRSLAGFAADPEQSAAFRLTRADTSGHVRKRIDRLAKKSRAELLAEIGSSDKWRPVSRERWPQFEAALASYRRSLPDGPAREAPLALLDVHQRRGAGNGSLGRHRYHLRVEAGEAGTLILEFKEQGGSALRLKAAAGGQPPLPDHHGHRVAAVIRRLQPAADPHTGWTTMAGLPFLVREKSPFEASLDCDKLAGSRDWQALARYTGQLLARTHALGSRRSAAGRQALETTALRLAAGHRAFAEELEDVARRLAARTEAEHRAFRRWHEAGDR